MSDYASGKHANGTCDRCGFVYKLKTLRALIINEVKTDTLVCTTCWDEDHPQLRVGKYPVRDPQAIKDPRPDTPSGED